ncbi:hypothetical protein CPB85DRAFT_1325463 [Mucidula mucida]|nr:hypothetical protein CPB85DRAFT_1325463 [Mucidula mucida]
MADCCKPLWTSTLNGGEVFEKMLNSPIKGKCWQDMFMPLPVRKYRLVKEKRRGFLRFFQKPRLVREYFEAEGRLPKMGLVTIGTLKGWVNKKIMELNTEDRFVVSTVERGVLHVEWTEDPSEWLAREVLELPSELLVGDSPRNVLDENSGHLPRHTTQAHPSRRSSSIWRRSTRMMSR